ncbi:hypothetical protein HRI_000569300 [Hibiscus trionum]|uniref:Uncharacterized protein n=1 Tax=Hibiscus trionum TaxID=183268 RepID=A0A9W7H0T9_HIBTR|nr:hypothetical protein HRI_000569300 [Hibiscus trionum]
MASSSLPSSFAIISPSSKHCTRQAIHVRAQSFREGDGSSSRVDANLSVLKERIEKVKTREKMEKCCRSRDDIDKCGWNYAAGYDYKPKRGGHYLSQLFQLLALVGASIGFTCVTATLFLCLVSLLFHFHH